MPTYRYVAVDPDGDRGQGRRSTRRARPRCRNELLLRNLEVQQRQAAKTLVQRARAHAAARPAVRDHALLAPDGGVRAQPASRSPTRSRSSRRARATSASGRSCSTMQRSRSATACRSPTRSPSTTTIFPPYYLGILQSAELTGRLDIALEQLSGYIERDLEAKSKIKSALMYPMVVLGMSIVTVVDPHGLGAAEVRRRSSRTSARSCRCRPACCIGVAKLHEGLLVRVPARRARRSAASACWLQKTANGTAAPRPDVLLRMPARQATSCSTPSSSASAGSSARCRRPVCRCPTRMPRRDRGREQHACSRSGLQPAQERMLEGEGLAEPIARHAAVPAGRRADDARRRGHRNARPPARERGRLLPTRARVQAQEAHDAVRAGGHRLHGPASSASSRSRSCRRCTASTTPRRSTTSDGHSTPALCAAMTTPASRSSSCS